MGAGARYQRRKHLWVKNHRVLPRVRHHAWWVLHNCVSHPLMGLRASPTTVLFHDWTSMHLNQRNEIRHSPPPEIKSRVIWAGHNILGHLAIGLAPCKTTFEFHDRGAEAMGVPYWV